MIGASGFMQAPKSEERSGITSITITTAPSRQKPKVGDIRVTKKHGREVRVRTMVHDLRGRVICYNNTGGRPNYHWVALTAENIKKHRLEYLNLIP